MHKNNQSKFEGLRHCTRQAGKRFRFLFKRLWFELATIRAQDQRATNLAGWFIQAMEWMARYTPISARGLLMGCVNNHPFSVVRRIFTGTDSSSHSIYITFLVYYQFIVGYIHIYTLHRYYHYFNGWVSGQDG